MRAYHPVLAFLILFLCTGSLFAQMEPGHSLIPYPVKTSVSEGSFTIKPATPVIISASGQFKSEATLLSTLFEANFGNPLKISTKKKSQAISLRYDAAIEAPEGYKLSIRADGITISASHAAGIFYGIESIRQLLPAEIEGASGRKAFSMPLSEIEDQPAYAWRGMMLDVSRHFFSVSYLKKFIDRMSLYKMNKLHLHLTDDQGWRIEIKKYPELTRQGAWRTFNNQDSSCIKRSVDNPDLRIDSSHIIHRGGKTLYGGFYTQTEMKGVVAYALKRHVDIIPELDMPGHMMAAINSYPWLTCNGENKWGALFTKPICPCNESTFTFTQNVYKEIMDIFPSKYLHIGGDEVDRTDWGKSDACKALMKKEGIQNLAALQSYFINRMEKFFNSKGRKLVGWDEIIEGGISPTALVMYWRSWVHDAPAKAVKNGNTVIMSPGNPLYFDNPADKYSIFNVYHFDALQGVLSKEEGKSVLGAQANVWTEGVPTENRADFLTMPRMTALAEMLWTNDTTRYVSYQKRLVMQYRRMDLMKIHYRLPDLEGLVEENVFIEPTTLQVAKPLPDLTIHYTLDGSLPALNSAELNAPLSITKSERIKLAAFTKGGSRGDVYTLNYQKQTLAGPVSLSHLTDGLICTYYKAQFKTVKAIGARKPDSSFYSSSIQVPSAVKAPSFGINYTGYLQVPDDGIYSFFLVCDDGGVLTIAGRETVNNDGNHSAIEKSGQVALKQGLHSFLLQFIEGGGGFKLQLQYSKDGSKPQNIPASWFKREAKD